MLGRALWSGAQTPWCSALLHMRVQAGEKSRRRPTHAPHGCRGELAHHEYHTTNYPTWAAGIGAVLLLQQLERGKASPQHPGDLGPRQTGDTTPPTHPLPADIMSSGSEYLPQGPAGPGRGWVLLGTTTAQGNSSSKLGDSPLRPLGLLASQLPFSSSFHCDNAITAGHSPRSSSPATLYDLLGVQPGVNCIEVW